nr:hypothetical protein [Microvirga arsenatis]
MTHRSEDQHWRNSDDDERDEKTRKRDIGEDSAENVGYLTEQQGQSLPHPKGLFSVVQGKKHGYKTEETVPV